MFERLYRRRLEADLARWQTEGVITAAVGNSIRNSLPPISASINIAVVVGITGGLLIAAAFLAFVAANWSEIARPLRFCILLVGIGGAHGIGSWFARTDRPVLADLAVAVGTIIYGAAIALVGQMYHLGDDFAGGMLLWSIGALAAAALTQSRGALAVALVAGSIWSGWRVFEASDIPHLPFAALWLFAVGLALTWQSRVADHLVAAAALVWWIIADIGRVFAGGPYDASPLSIITGAGAAVMLGTGLVLAESHWDTIRKLGDTLSTYGAFALAGAAAVTAIGSHNYKLMTEGGPSWAVGCAAVGALLVFIAAAIGRRPGPALAGIAVGFAVVAAAGFVPQTAGSEPWLAYALELIAMLCLVVSGMLDEVRPRVVAGWIGLAAVVAAITWGVKGSLLRRSVFLATAGAAAVGLAFLLGRLLPSEGTKS
jgi:uncharacterized membrane protein